MTFTKTLSFFATMVLCTADPIKDPARIRLNSDLLKTVFHSGDQRILDVFTDLELGNYEQVADDVNTAFTIEDATVSIMTADGVD